MFSSVYNWAVSKVVYPPSVDSSLSSSAISASSSRPSPLCIDEKYVSDDEFIVVHTPDIKQTPPPTPKLLTDFNECIINNYQENHEQYNVPSGPTLIDSLSDSPQPDALPSHPHPSLSPIKTNFEESKENPNDTGMNEKIGFRVLRFTRDGLIKNETNLSPSPSDTLADQPSVGHVRSLYQLAVSGDGGAITQLNYLSEKQKNNKRMQEIGVWNKSLIAKREKKTIKLSDDDHTVYEGSSKGGKSEPDWNKINERQAAKRALQQQRRLNDKLITKDRRAAAQYKSGGSIRKGKNKIRLDDE